VHVFLIVETNFLTLKRFKMATAKSSKKSAKRAQVNTSRSASKPTGQVSRSQPMKYSSRKEDGEMEKRNKSNSKTGNSKQSYGNSLSSQKSSGNNGGRYTSSTSARDDRGSGNGHSKGKMRNTGASGKSQHSQTRPSGKQEEGLRKLFMDQLKDMYWAEKALTKALPKMIKEASSNELIDALSGHLDETEGQVTKLEQVFQKLGEKASAQKCEAMEGLIEEATEIMGDLEKGSVKDAGIICAGQKVEHYEIGTYGCLKTYAGILGEMDVADLLDDILSEEKNADETLTQVAQSINWEAANESEEEDESDEEGDETDEEDEEDEDVEVYGTKSNKRYSGAKK
jgi:ferritin-like metal-binding protein YciE